MIEFLPPPATGSHWTPRRIRAMRAAYGWTQDRLAAEVGVDRTTIAKWERGYFAPTAHRAVAALERLEAAQPPPAEPE